MMNANNSVQNIFSETLASEEPKLPLNQSGRHLAYTVALDPPGSPGHRLMAKMLASSLLRSHFDGDIIVFRNSTEPIFRVQRQGLEEFYIPTPDLHGYEGAQYSWCWKYRVRQFIEAKRYDKVLFLDADCLALRNIDHLLEGNWDLAYKPELGLNIDLPQFSCFLTDNERAILKRPGVNSGTLAVRGEIFDEVMALWERIDQSDPPQIRTCSDQASWNRLLLNAEATRMGKDATGFKVPPWRALPFEKGEVLFPMYLDSASNEYMEASLVHCLGGNTRQKLKFMFGLYMSTFYYDDNLTLLNLMEM